MPRNPGNYLDTHRFILNQGPRPTCAERPICQSQFNSNVRVDVVDVVDVVDAVDVCSITMHYACPTWKLTSTDADRSHSFSQGLQNLISHLQQGPQSVYYDNELS